MKISVFKNNIFSIGVDYSDRELCLWVFDITEQSIEKLKDWCTCDVIDWELIITENDNYIKSQIKKSLSRMQEIRVELVRQWFTADLPTDSRIDWKLLLYKDQLLSEYDRLQVFVDDTYEASLIDDVIASFFPTL